MWGWSEAPPEPPRDRSRAIVTITVTVGVVAALLVVVLLAAAYRRATTSTDDPPRFAATPPTVQQTIPPAPAQAGYEFDSTHPPPRVPTAVPTAAWQLALPPPSADPSMAVESIWVGPTIVGDMIVVFSTGGRAVGVDRATGAVRWESRFTMRSPMTATTPQMAAGDGIVLATTAGALIAIDVHDGTIRWSHPLLFAPKFIADASHVIIDGGREIFALDPATGTTQWSAPSQLAPTGQPASLSIDGDAVMIGTSGGLRVVDAATGADKWQAALPTAITAAVRTPSAFVTLDNSGALRAFGLDGAPQWATPLDDHTRTDARSLLVIGTRVIVATAGGPIAFDLADGAEAWRTRIASDKDASLRSAGDQLVEVHDYGLVFFSAQTGSPHVIWLLGPNRPVASPAEPAGDQIMVFLGTPLTRSGPTMLSSYPHP